MTRRRRAPQYGRQRPDFSVLHQKMEASASEEMRAFDQLPPELKEFLRTSKVGWKSAKILGYLSRLGYDVDLTLQLLRGVEESFRDNQLPTGDHVTVTLVK